MTTNSFYEYISQSNIDPGLICTYCCKPFINPVMTECGYTYCLPCIQDAIKNNSPCPSPSCEKLLSTSHLATVYQHSIVSMLNRLKVRCMLCGEENLEREKFDEHINENCREYRLDCPRKDVGCLWFGQRNQLQLHMSTCIFDSLQPAFNALIETNQNLNLKRLHELSESFKAQLEEQRLQFEEAIQKQAIELKQVKLMIEQYTNQMQTQKSQLGEQKIQMGEEIRKQKVVFEQYTIQIETKEKDRLEAQQIEMELKMKQQKIEYQKLIEEYKTQLYSINSQHQKQKHEIESAHNQITLLEREIKNLKNSIRFLLMPNIPENARWKQNGVTVTGGKANNERSYPYGLFVDDDQTLIIAEYEKNRITQWKKNDQNGQVIAGGNGQGNRLDQLNHPTDVLFDKETESLIIADRNNRRVVRWSRRDDTRKVEILLDNIDCWGLAMDYQRYLYVSDTDCHEVRRYTLGESNGTLVAGGNGHGSDFNQLNGPSYIFVDRKLSVYVADNNNHRVMKWDNDAKEGTVVAGGQGYGDSRRQLYWPNGIFVDTLGTVYVADEWNNRVMRWPQRAEKGSVIAGGNGEGEKENELSSPRGLFIDRYGNLYVADCNNKRVQRFSIE